MDSVLLAKLHTAWLNERLAPSITGRKKLAALELLAGSVAAIAFCTWAAFQLKLGIASTGFVYLFLVVLGAVYGGFWVASVISVTAVVCLNYFFVPPIFSFQVGEPEDFVALCAFEFTALIVSRLESTANKKAAEATSERRESERLYNAARRILLFERAKDAGPQLAALLREIFELEAVVLFDATPARIFASGNCTPETEERTRGAYFQNSSQLDPATNTWFCVLHLDARPVGGLALCGGVISPLAASALASLCAIAFERARSLEREFRAEAGRQSEQLRAAVLDALGHDVKTPVATIWAASSGLLAAGGLSPMQTDLLTLIDEQSQKLNDLTSRLLGTARLDSTNFEPQRRPILVSKVINVVIQGLDPEDRDRIRVSGPESEAPILADARLIAAALTQLVDNAVKYSVPESPIDLSVEVSDAEAIVTVRDKGSSIQPQDRERIFERFYRGDGTTHGPAGTGLGLSIVKRVVEAHHGRVWVDSNSEGAVFYLALPLAPKAAAVSLSESVHRNA
jgi:two-component system sensor histidine kinase KdpD